MYKIKDNVDLRKLERYRFRRLLLLGDGHLPRYIRAKKNISVSVCCVFRTIRIFDNRKNFNNIVNDKKYIKDLIQAGLVEKVADNESNND